MTLNTFYTRWVLLHLLFFSVLTIKLLLISPAWSINGPGGVTVNGASLEPPVETINLIGAVDAGELTFPGRIQKRITLEKVTNLPADWKIGSFTGWRREGKNDTLTLARGSLPPAIDISLLRVRPGQDVSPRERNLSQVRLIFSNEGRQVSFIAALEAGNHKIMVPLSGPEQGGLLNLNFVLPPAAGGPALRVNPDRIDLGAVRQSEPAGRQLRVTNGGTDLLRWTARAAPPRDIPDRRFLSLQGASPQGEPYQPPAHLQPQLELVGPWISDSGYPALVQAPATLRISFVGSGITLINPRLDENTDLNVTLNNEETILRWDDDERLAVIFPSQRQGLPEGAHVLLISVREGTFFLGGLEVHPLPLLRLPAAGIRLFPRQGTTTRETDFITFNLETRNLAPGTYFEILEISSNVGVEQIPLFLEIMPGGRGTFQDVFLYVNRAGERLLTSDLKVDARRIFVGAYQRRETAFQLFSPGTPGTTEFFRWYNPKTGNYFYSHDRQGTGRNLVAYLFEGSIGNIATSRLPGTRPLHRWFNKREERHLYTLDTRGEEPRRGGFAYEGIAGFVR